jgi:hypothetical protein
LYSAFVVQQSIHNVVHQPITIAYVAIKSNQQTQKYKCSS